MEDWAVAAVGLHRGWPGLLYQAGGYAEQPAPYIEMMHLLDCAKALTHLAAEEAASREAEFRRGGA